MAVCRSCKALIHWQRTEHGTSHPCDPGVRWVATDGREPADGTKKIRIVTKSSGRLVVGAELSAQQASHLAASAAGFESHFATCPFADEHRKKG